MIVIILSIILIILAVVERLIYKKMDENGDKLRLFIALLMVAVLFLISYFVTDTPIGVLYVFSAMSFYFLMGAINFRVNIEWIEYVANIIGLPLMVILFTKIYEYSLINFQLLILLFAIVNSILSYPYKRKGTLKGNISFGIGALIVVIIMYSYFNLPDIEDRLNRKQEAVAQKYLEDELDIYESYTYLRGFEGSLRGEVSTVTAYDESGNLLLLKYRDNKIVSYERVDNLDDSSSSEDYFFEPSISQLEGELKVKMYYGPPGYGENPDTDKPLYPFILELNQPINVIALEDDKFNSDKFEVKEIQVVPSNEEESKLLEEYINKSIIIKGSLFEALLGHAHHTEVVLDMEEILK